MGFLFNAPNSVKVSWGLLKRPTLSYFICIYFSKVKCSFSSTFTVFYLCLPHKYINFITKTGIQRRG